MRLSHFLFPALLGFVSGIPLMLTGSTLQAWGTTAGLNLMALGSLTLIGQPYIYKFLWAPLLDRYQIPLWHGHRRGWILTMMLLLVVSLYFLSITKPTQHLAQFITLASITAFFSATLDIAIDAYRLTLLPKEDYGLGNASYVSAYRISMLVSGGLALIIADYYGWHFTYQLMVGLILAGFFLFLFSKEPANTNISGKTISWRQSLLDPIKELWNRQYILPMLLFVILYKLGTALGSALNSTFLLRELHFSLTALGGIYKTVALFATIFGAFVGGYIYKRLTLFNTLFLFGWLQAIALLTFAWLAYVGQNYPLMITSVAAEALTAGMATTVFLALLMRLCNPFYAATHFALLSALDSLGRVFTGPLASLLVKHYQWAHYFIISFFFCIPGLLLLWWLKPNLEKPMKT